MAWRVPARPHAEAAFGKESLPVPGKLWRESAMLVRRKNVNNTVDCGGGRIGVQGAKGQVTVSAIRSADSSVSGRAFRDQHHVRIFTERSAKRVGEGLRVRVHFTLVTRQLLFWDELDWSSMVIMWSWRSVLILSSMASQCGGLAGGPWTGDQNQAARLVTQFKR